MQDSNLRPFRYERTATDRTELTGLKLGFDVRNTLYDFNTLHDFNLQSTLSNLKPPAVFTDGEVYTYQIYPPSQRVSPIGISIP